MTIPDPRFEILCDVDKAFDTLESKGLLTEREAKRISRRINKRYRRLKRSVRRRI